MKADSDIGQNRSRQSLGRRRGLVVRLGKRGQGSDHTASVLEAAQFLDVDDDGIAVFHPDLRVAAHADAVRCAGEDHISRLQGEGIGAEFDQFGHAEDHLARITLLHDFTVEEAADAEILGVRHLVGGHKGGTDGAEGVEAFAPDPLGVAQLQVAGAYVVGAGVAGHVIERVGAADMAGGLADHHSQFGLVVHFCSQGRAPDDFVAGANDTGRELGEDDGTIRGRGIRFAAVVQVVQTNGDDLAGPVHGTEELDAAPVDGVGHRSGLAGQNIAPGSVGDFDGVAAGDAVHCFSVMLKPQPSHLICSSANWLDRIK